MQQEEKRYRATSVKYNFKINGMHFTHVRQHWFILDRKGEPAPGPFFRSCVDSGVVIGSYASYEHVEQAAYYELLRHDEVALLGQHLREVYQEELEPVEVALPLVPPYPLLSNPGYTRTEQVWELAADFPFTAACRFWLTPELLAEGSQWRRY